MLWEYIRVFEVQIAFYELTAKLKVRYQGFGQYLPSEEEGEMRGVKAGGDIEM